MFRHACFLLELLAVQFFFLASAYAAPTTIDFEPHFRGEIVREQYLAQGVRISAVNWSHGPDYAVVFDSLNIGDSSDEDLEAPFDPAPGYEDLGELWPGHVLILHERHDCESGLCLTPDDEGSRPAGWIEFEFAVPTTLHGMTVIDINYEDGETPAQLVLYDDNGTVIDSLDVPEGGGQGHWRPWEIARNGISRARLYLPGDAAIDDLSFTPESSVNWTPEFVSHPPVAVAPGEVYRYRPDIRDPGGDPDDAGDAIQLDLVEAPQGMTATGGELEWTAAEEGTFDVVLRASDENGASATQDFTIHVTEEFIRIQDFEFATGTILDDELLADGLHVKAKNFSSGSDYVVAFDTNNPTGGDADLEAPFSEGVNNDLELGPANPGKVLVLHEEHDCDVLDRICQEPDDETTRPAGWFEFRFTQPAHVYSLDVFDIRGSDPADRTVEFYDSNDEPIPVSLSMPRTGASRWDRFDIDVPGVRRMRLNLDGDGGFDRLHYALLGEGEPDNLEPRANPDAYSVEQDETLVVDAPGVLENDSDPDEDELTAETETSPAHGILLLNPDGSFTYTPDPGYSGQDQFTYAADDGELSASAVVDIDVIESLQVIIDHFNVSPSTINPGDAATLSWAVQNADQVHIEPGLADLPASGSVSVSPDVTTTYVLTASGQGGEPVTASRTLVVDESEPEPEPDGPLIAFYWPEEGDGVNWLTPPLALEVMQQTVMGVNPESTQIFMDGEPFPIDCGYDGNRFVVCHPLTELTVGNHSATARIADYVGNYSNTVTRNFYVDITPPTPPDAGKISVSAPDQEGKSLVTGMPGAAEPGNVLQLRSEQSIRHDVPIQPDGSFAVSIDASIGEEIRIRTMDHAGNFSEDVFLPVYSAAPEIEIVAPVDDALINSVQPSIDIEYLETGSGLDFSTLEVTVNGQPAAVDCTHDVSQSQCMPVEPLAEGENVISVRIADTRGEISEAASVSIIVDTIPPAGLDREKVSVEQVSGGTTVITGEADAAEPFARIVMTWGDLETETYAGVVGEFSIYIDASTGDEIHMTTVDGAGNHSDAEIFIVQPIPIQVEILEPYDGQHITGNSVIVRGSHNGDSASGVTVNGRRAMVTSDGTFIALDVPLDNGDNVIVAEAESFTGESGNTEIMVTSDAEPAVARLYPSTNDVPSPAEVDFEFSYNGNINYIHHYELDVNGDGTSEFTFTDPATELSHVYDIPGVYEPRLIVYTQDEVVEARSVINVIDAGDLQDILESVWIGWQTELVDGNIQEALRYLSPSKRERYESLFEGLDGRWPGIFDSFTGFEPAILSAGFSEYAVSRVIDGEERLFLIYFSQDEKGIWRLHSF